jgi:hypothetical protein
MKLINLGVKYRETGFWCWKRSFLEVQGPEVFRIPYSKLSEGIQKVAKQDGTNNYFLYETNGKEVFISSFSLGPTGAILWKRLDIIPYDDIRSPKTSLLPLYRDVIKRLYA